MDFDGSHVVSGGADGTVRLSLFGPKGELRGALLAVFHHAIVTVLDEAPRRIAAVFGADF